MAPTAVLISVYANLEHYIVYCVLNDKVTIEDVRSAVFTTRCDKYRDSDFQEKTCKYEEPFIKTMGLEEFDRDWVPHFWAYEIGLDDFGPTPPMEAASYVVIDRDGRELEDDGSDVADEDQQVEDQWDVAQQDEPLVVPDPAEPVVVPDHMAYFRGRKTYQLPVDNLSKWCSGLIPSSPLDFC